MPALNQIILIDDDPLTTLLFEKVNTLADFATEIITFYSAVDALDYLREVPTAPDAIFLDIGMPIVNGWQFLERFKALDATDLSSTAVVMLTTSTDQSDINRAKNFENVADYVVKPLTVARLQRIQSRLADLTSASVPSV